MKVFLTGGTGFIGQPLTKALLKRDWSVMALVRNPAGLQSQALRKIGAELAPGDITRRESMRMPMEGADIVIHNAAHYEFGIGKEGRQNMRSVNVDGTENVLSLAYELRIARTIHVSTILAIGETGGQQRDETYTRQYPCRSTYEQTKTEAHEIARKYQQRGLPLIIVCPGPVIGVNDHSVWGYFQRLYVNRILPPMAWSPETIFCCVQVEDLAEGIALAAEKGRFGETYLLGGERQSFRDICSLWAKKPGAFQPKVWIPASLAAPLFAMLEPLERLAGLPAFLSRETVRTAATNMNYSSEKAKRELGWQHCSAEEMWIGTIDKEIQLLSKRKTQKLIQRLKPMDGIE
jgi:dihydroflavonol-4-reductase